MPGAKIPILEVEKLRIADDGAGIDFVNDGTCFLVGRNWSGRTCSGSASGNAARYGSEGTGKPLFLCANSSSGWMRITVRSGSATDTPYYIPIFSNVNTKTSS